MAISWFISTVATSALIILIEHLILLSAPEGTMVTISVPGFLVVIGINLFFWLPAVIYLHKNKKVSLYSSVTSSLAAAVIGSASIIGVIILLLTANGGQFQRFESTGGQLTGYTSWTIGHIHYWPGIVGIIVLWGINGILFWRLYGRLSTNK
jgi:phosphoglycerol transferase MdoB-like AlkP superfamily enzyme